MIRGTLVGLLVSAALTGCGSPGPAGPPPAGPPPAEPVPAEAPHVRVVRLPSGGLQPETARAADGTVHLVYLAGTASAADVYYARSTDGGATFTPPLRVNSQPGSAIATGTVRGAQIALGRAGRVHVAWNGSGAAAPRNRARGAPSTSTSPFLYTRLNDSGDAFEPQRNLMTRTIELDGGGTLAADAAGHVYAAWHGRTADVPGGEEHRRVWLARSDDDGTTFEAERAIAGESLGVCGCCALRLAVAPDRTLQLLYRSAGGGTHRDVHALTSGDGGLTFSDTPLDRWEIGACPMTSMAIATAPRILYAWETDGQVFYRAVGAASPIAPPSPPATAGPAARRKHPRLAALPDGRVLLAWTEGTSWGRGGTLAWQTFDADGHPVSSGSGPGVPPWSFAATVPLANNEVLVLY